MDRRSLVPPSPRVLVSPPPLWFGVAWRVDVDSHPVWDHIHINIQEQRHAGNVIAHVGLVARQRAQKKTKTNVYGTQSLR